MYYICLMTFKDINFKKGILTLSIYFFKKKGWRKPFLSLITGSTELDGGVAVSFFPSGFLQLRLILGPVCGCLRFSSNREKVWPVLALASLCLPPTPAFFRGSNDASDCGLSEAVLQPAGLLFSFLQSFFRLVWNPSFRPTLTGTDLFFRSL